MVGQCSDGEPNADEIVLPCFTCVGSLVPVSAVSVALAEPVLPGEVCGTLSDHLEDIVAGSHHSLGGGRSDVAQGPPPSVRACFPGARGTYNRTYVANMRFVSLYRRGL